MYDKNPPLFPFGYGLTYTNFEYSGLKTDKKTLSDNGIVNISFNIRNTGNYDSDEVVQLYVSFPDSKVERPAKLSRDLPGSFVKKGEAIPVTIRSEGK